MPIGLPCFPTMGVFASAWSADTKDLTKDTDSLTMVELFSAGCRCHLRDMCGCWRSQTKRLPLPQGYPLALLFLRLLPPCWLGPLRIPRGLAWDLSVCIRSCTDCCLIGSAARFFLGGAAAGGREHAGNRARDITAAGAGGKAGGPCGRPLPAGPCHHEQEGVSYADCHWLRLLACLSS